MMPSVKMRENGKMLPWVKTTIGAIALVLSLGGFALTHERRHAVGEANIEMVEHRIGEEVKGYQAIFKAMNERFDRFESKQEVRLARLERRMDRILENQARSNP